MIMSIVKLVFEYIPIKLRVVLLAYYSDSYIGSNIRISPSTNFFAARSSKWSFGDNIIFSDGKRNPTCSRPCKIVIGKEARLKIGSNVGMSGTFIGCYESISIGDNCVIGGDVTIFDTNFHSLNYIDRRKDKGKIKTSAVKIGEDCFIGAKTIITKGVTIGDRAIVSVSSLVLTNIPDDEVWGGVPAVKIR
jgi:carbonic anhydrase/acetyltransferase-like protein (isoleucine patch superfamily)